MGNSVEPGIWRMQASCLRTLRRRRRAGSYPAAISRAGAGPASEAAARYSRRTLNERPLILPSL
ncbi:hypothetical protein K3Z89_17605, partial [Pseudomonas aeruginosa]|nr:hypothetical protein [Pseudomonas aeruginosa]